MKPAAAPEPTSAAPEIDAGGDWSFDELDPETQAAILLGEEQLRRGEGIPAAEVLAALRSRRAAR